MFLFQSNKYFEWWLKEWIKGDVFSDVELHIVKEVLRRYHNVNVDNYNHIKGICKAVKEQDIEKFREIASSRFGDTMRMYDDIKVCIRYFQRYSGTSRDISQGCIDPGKARIELALNPL